MCGISGVFYKKEADPVLLKQAVQRMSQYQFSRGPDDEGFCEFQNGCFGHRRLAIIDLSKAGKQPMGYYFPRQSASSLRKSASCWLTFNGEIYNFSELKKELEIKGYKFNTKTDTEVILALYAEYGERSFAMLRGMFAFGLWDDIKQTLFLVKDRFGIKPLYYWNDNEKLIFASEVKAIAASSLITLSKNEQAFIGFLLFGSVPLPYTTYKNIKALSAGYYLKLDAEGNQQFVQYYNPLEAFQNKKDVGSLEEAVKETRSRLEEAVRTHLISDAPLGIFLSGGLDSSALAALAVNQRIEPITTLSVIFEEKDFSEKFYQDLVVRKIKSVHQEIKITAKDFYNSFDEIFKAMDQPTIDGVNTFFIALAAKRAGLKTVLSGLGSDEFFLGYKFFKIARTLRKIQSAIGFLGVLRIKKSILSLLLRNHYSKLSYFFDNDVLSFYLGFRGLFNTEETARILDINEAEVLKFIETLKIDYLFSSSLAKLHPIDLLSYFELKFYLQNQLLKDTDFMSMRHSIEVRVPFLDHPLVEYLSSLPPSLKINPKINKPLLVEAMRDLVPEEILIRKKMGFTFPFGQWLKQMSLDSIFNSTSAVSKDFMFRFKSNKIHWSKFWSLAVLDRF